jgi:uncharacterized protein (TIGR03066 family)
MKNLVALVIILLFAGASGWAVWKYFVLQEPAPSLVGTWEVTNGPMQGASYEFRADGALTIRSNQGPDTQAQTAVEGKTLVTTSKHPVTLQDETRKNTIQELTATSLVLEQENGDVVKMVRKK